MRTTVEITDSQRASLLKLAADRGEKGFSRLVQEAIDRYLAEQADRRAKIDAALAVIGTLDDEAAERMLESVRRSRASWR